MPRRRTFLSDVKTVLYQMAIDPQKLNEKELAIYNELKEVADPELGASIIDMGLVDEISVEGTEARITYHLTVPMCPPVMALYIGNEIKKKLLRVQGVERASVRVTNHYYEKEINQMLAQELKPESGETQAPK